MSASFFYRRSAATAFLAVAACLTLAGGPAVAAPSPAPSDPGGPVPQVTPQQRAIELVQPATVFVRTDWSANVDYGGDEPIFREWHGGCTGQVVSADGYVVTAGHCAYAGSDGAKREAVSIVVDELIAEGLFEADLRDELVKAAMSGRDRWIVFGEDRDAPPNVEVQVQLGGGVASLPDKKDPKGGIRARVVETVPYDKGDVALLKVEETNLPVAELAPRDEAQVGQELLAIGYPFEEADGDEVALTSQDGRINSIDPTGGLGPGDLSYRTSTALSDGMSGGPVVDLNGRVVGIASSTSANNKGNYIAPASVVAELLNRHGVENQLGRADRMYRTALDDFYHGYYSDAIRGFDEVADIVPTHALAKEKSRKAADLRQRYGDQARPTVQDESDRNLLLLWGGVGAAATLLVVLLLLGMRYWTRRRGATPASVDPMPAGLLGSAYGPGMDDDTYVGLVSPVYGNGPYPPAGLPPYSDAADPASAPPASTPPASAPPAGAPPVSVPPVSAPPGTYRSEAAVPPPFAGGFCSSCGTQHGAADKFCSRCGHRLGAPVAGPQ